MAARLPELLRVGRATALTAAAAALTAAVQYERSPVWGFYAHREINRQAVYTLPGRLAGWYKANVDYVSAHAVDPDKRRYAAPLEGARHFIDLERYGDGTVASLPGDFWEFHDAYTALVCRRGDDSLRLDYADDVLFVGSDTFRVAPWHYGEFYRAAVLPAYFEQTTTLDTTLASLATRSAELSCEQLIVVDTMTEHGVLPYHLESAQRQLTRAFAQGDLDRALQLSAELGHYLGDATVPLHTTANYDGQLTGQRGIHAFWESRIPELFAEEDFDGLVGPARYIDDERAYFRELIADSHAHVDSVLLIEADLRRRIPAELQDCYEERLGDVVRVPCRRFARAYYERLDGMVEERFRAAILATGSMWYTAWVDGGMPELGGGRLKAAEVSDTLVGGRGELDGRGH